MLKPRKSCSRVCAVCIYTNQLVQICDSKESKTNTQVILKLFSKRMNKSFINHPKYVSKKKTKMNIIQRASRATEQGMKYRPKALQGSRRRRQDRLETHIVSSFFAHPLQGVPTTFLIPPAAPKSLPKVSQTANRISKSHYPITLT